MRVNTNNARLAGGCARRGANALKCGVTHHRLAPIFGWSAGLESAKRLMSGRITSCRKCRTQRSGATPERSEDK